MRVRIPQGCIGEIDADGELSIHDEKSGRKLTSFELWVETQVDAFSLMVDDDGQVTIVV